VRDRTLFEQPPNTVHNAIRYADFAVGEVFRLARQQPYFANRLPGESRSRQDAG